jgi:hypothetical protein
MWQIVLLLLLFQFRFIKKTNLKFDTARLYEAGKFIKSIPAFINLLTRKNDYAIVLSGIR